MLIFYAKKLLKIVNIIPVSASKGSHTPLNRVAQSVPLQAPETLVASDNDADPGSGPHT